MSVPHTRKRANEAVWLSLMAKSSRFVWHAPKFPLKLMAETYENGIRIEPFLKFQGTFPDFPFGFFQDFRGSIYNRNIIAPSKTFSIFYLPEKISPEKARK